MRKKMQVRGGIFWSNEGGRSDEETDDDELTHRAEGGITELRVRRSSSAMLANVPTESKLPVDTLPHLEEIGEFSRDTSALAIGLLAYDRVANALKAPPHSKPLQRPNRFGRICTAAFLLIAAFFGGKSMLPSNAPNQNVQRPPAALAMPKSRNIEQLHVGDRVLASNPEITDSERMRPEVDQATWRRLSSCGMVNEDGGTLYTEFLRPQT